MSGSDPIQIGGYNAAPVSGLEMPPLKSLEKLPMADQDQPLDPETPHVSGTISQKIVEKQSSKRSSAANCSPTVSPKTVEHIAHKLQRSSTHKDNASIPTAKTSAILMV